MRNLTLNSRDKRPSFVGKHTYRELQKDESQVCGARIHYKVPETNLHTAMRLSQYTVIKREITFQKSKVFLMLKIYPSAVKSSLLSNLKYMCLIMQLVKFN